MINFSPKSKRALGIISAALVMVLLLWSISSALSANLALRAMRQSAETTGPDTSAEMAERLAKAAAEAEELRDSIAALMAEIAVLRANEDAQQMAEQIVLLEQTLKETITLYENQINELDELIKVYQTVYAIDVIAQGEIINELLELLSSGAPERRVVKDGESGDTDPTEPEYIPAKVALFYKDLTTGYTFAYNENEALGAASLFKLTYLWSVLKRVSAEEDAAAKRAQEYKESELQKQTEESEPAYTSDTNTFDEDLYEWPDYIFEDARFDLSEVVILDKETMMQEGSGVIKWMDDGTEFTYLELIEYALCKSDNIAFALLCERFGFDDFFRDATAIGVKTVRTHLYRMTAKEGGLFLSEIYDFIETDERYGTFLKNCMVNSAHTVMIPHAVYPTVAAHKYGWDIDAYNDMAIVYNDKPYVLIFMSDLDEGSNNKDVNAYVKQVLTLINKLHNNYYKKA